MDPLLSIDRVRLRAELERLVRRAEPAPPELVSRLLDDHAALLDTRRALEGLVHDHDRIRAQIAAYYGGRGLLDDLQRGHRRLLRELAEARTRRRPS